MSNILIFLDMPSKRVHFYSEIEFHIVKAGSLDHIKPVLITI